MMTTTGTAVRSYMTASETVAMFKRGLDEELGLATAHRIDAADERTTRVLAAVHRMPLVSTPMPRR